MTDNQTSRGVRNDIRANDINRTTVVERGFVTDSTLGFVFFANWHGSNTNIDNIRFPYTSEIIGFTVQYQDNTPWPGYQVTFELGYIPDEETFSESNFVSLGEVIVFEISATGRPVRELTGIKTRIPENVSVVVKAVRIGTNADPVTYNVALWVRSALPI